MTGIRPIRAGEEFRAFWNSRHPSPLSGYGFEPEDALHFAFERRGAGGGIDAALILVPCFRDGDAVCHHVHLCSDLRSKALFRFCNDVMISAATMPEVGWVVCETQGRPELRPVERIAATLGFSPVYVKPDDGGAGWVDFAWNSKGEVAQ